MKTDVDFGITASVYAEPVRSVAAAWGRGLGQDLDARAWDIDDAKQELQLKVVDVVGSYRSAPRRAGDVERDYVQKALWNTARNWWSHQKSHGWRLAEPLTFSQERALDVGYDPEPGYMSAEAYGILYERLAPAHWAVLKAVAECGSVRAAHATYYPNRSLWFFRESVAKARQAAKRLLDRGVL